MAKTKFLVLALALSVAASGFAVPVGDSGLDISGGIWAGVEMGGSQSKTGSVEVGNPPFAKFYDNESDSGDAMRVQVRFKYVNGAQGAVVRLRSQPPSASPAFVINQAFGWTDLFIPQLKFTGGKNMDAEWATWSVSEGNWVDNGFEGTRGLRLEVKPIEGVSIGAGFFSFDLIGLDDVRPAEHLKFTTLGAGYSNNDLGVKAAVSATFNAVSYAFDDSFYSSVGHVGAGQNSTSLWNYKATTPAYDPNEDGGGDAFKDHKYFEILGGGTYTGVDNLVVSLDFDVVSAENKVSTDTVKVGSTTVALFGKYTLGPLGLPLYLVANMKSLEWGKTIKTGSFTVRLQPGYDITPQVNASLRIQYALDAFGNDDFKELATTQANGVKGDYKGGSAIDIRPCFAFDFGNGVSFSAYYNHNIKTDAKLSAADPTTTNTETVHLQVSYSF